MTTVKKKDYDYLASLRYGSYFKSLLDYLNTNNTQLVIDKDNVVTAGISDIKLGNFDDRARTIILYERSHGNKNREYLLLNTLLHEALHSILHAQTKQELFNTLHFSPGRLARWSSKQSEKCFREEIVVTKVTMLLIKQIFGIKLLVKKFFRQTQTKANSYSQLEEYYLHRIFVAELASQPEQKLINRYGAASNIYYPMSGILEEDYQVRGKEILKELQPEVDALLPKGKEIFSV